MNLGLIVPFRDEALVLGRKLANLERLRWPAGAHRVVLADDHSRDPSAELARAFCRAARSRPFDAELLDARAPAGKPSAIRGALDRLGTSVELIVLSDADVVLAEGALIALADAFEREDGLVLASGAQRFVRELAEDGSPPTRESSEDASTAWDRWTERMRALESRVGLLFNVHGQLMAWRRSAGLAPTIGLAADDLDLVLQARARGAGRARLVDGAVFYEEKPSDPRARRAQARRRMRAFVQAMRSRNAPPGRFLERAQWRFYRCLPALLPAGLAAARDERAAPLADHWAKDRS